MDQEIIDRVKRECASSLKITLRRFEMLKNMAKNQRQYNHDEVVNSWQRAIDEYREKLINNGVE